MTGVSFTKCKEALLKFDNDVDEAQKWLKSEAVKQGWSKMGKLYDRPMSNGLLGLQIRHDCHGYCGVMLELNCETDFVARNQNFHKLLHKAMNACFQHFNELHEIHTLKLSTEELKTLRFIDNESQEDETVENLIASEVGSVGENMLVRRAVGMKTDNKSILAGYTHLSWQDINKRWKDTNLAKYSAILKYRAEESNLKDDNMRKEIVDIGRRICQHIVGMNPVKIGDLEKDVPNANSEAENVLIYQQYLLDEDIRIIDLLNRYGLVIEDFVRYSCGEEL